MDKRSLFMTIVLAVAVGGAVALLKLQWMKRNDPARNQNIYEHMGGDFNLTHKSGAFSLENLKGKPSLLYFGFTSCPDVCPLALNSLMRNLDAIDPEIHSKINKVFISVDYKRDTIQKINEYAKYFATDLIGLTGTKEEIERVTKNYGVHFSFVKMKDSKLDYTVDHTSRFFLLNKKGKLVATFSDLKNDPLFKEKLLRQVQ